ncbi:YbaK/EbsC family protein [Intestinibacter sp.]|uniref:YbaK/EbsC family protein n=1 Tax=Intestinibacter sp. TaxID=1965304 RepID=UPI002A90CF28|nr:YbaK/EbsC family protein [Intestinibacter sp.]MDY5211190.1 YbaK/EbsC family protein [Intestinibacter sp.]
MLKLTKGSVTPLGIVNDCGKITVLLDKDNKDQKVLLHPQFNTTTLSIKYSDLIRFIEYCGNKYIEV